MTSLEFPPNSETLQMLLQSWRQVSWRKGSLSRHCLCDLLFWNTHPSQQLGLLLEGSFRTHPQNMRMLGVHGGSSGKGAICCRHSCSAPVEAIRAVHPNGVLSSCCGAVLHGAESRGTLAQSESDQIQVGELGAGVLWEPECSYWCLFLALRLETINTDGQCKNFPLCWTA